MAKEVKYDEEREYSVTNSTLYTTKFHDNGKADFDHPADGYYFSPTEVTWEVVDDMNLDPRFVTKRMVGPNEKLCYMELTPNEIPNIEQSMKTENNKEQRRNRCRIISKKTGKVIMCPYDGAHKCETCENRFNKKSISTAAPFSSLATEYDNGDIVEYDPSGPYDTESDAVSNAFIDGIINMVKALDEEFSKKGKPEKHVKICLEISNSSSSTEISTDLNIPKATLSGDLDRIRTLLLKKGYTKEDFYS